MANVLIYIFISKIGEEQSSEDAEDGPPELLVRSDFSFNTKLYKNTVWEAFVVRGCMCYATVVLVSVDKGDCKSNFARNFPEKPPFYLQICYSLLAQIP